MSAPGRSYPSLLLGALTLGTGWYLAQRYLPGQTSFVVQALLFGLVLLRLSRDGVLAVSSPDRTMLAIPGALLLAAMLWRDSETLVVLDALAVVLLAALTVPDAAGLPLALSGPGAYVERVARAGAGWVLGAIPLAWCSATTAPRAGRWRSLAAVGLGVAAVSPALLIFAALLSSADPAFGRMLESCVAFNWRPLFPHVVGIALATWGAGGLLWAAASRPHGAALCPSGGRVGATTIFAALGAIEALFVLYVLLQSRYLFGGYAHVLAAERMTVADYARRGFFELVTVAALTLPIVLLADWALDERRREDRTRFRWHVLGLVGLLYVLLGSALSRMLLYTREFGLTESRVYVTAFLGWLACVFAWFALVQVRGTRERFASGAFALALQVLLLLNLLDVDGMIVRVNVARAADGRSFDRSYVTQLGAGSLPQVLHSAKQMPRPARCDLLREVQQRWAQEAERSPEPSWNVERARARGVLLERLEHRTRADCGDGSPLPPIMQDRL